MSLYKIGRCDYCGAGYRILRPSPFMADTKAMMCECCWNDTQKEYAASNGEYIPDFDSKKDEYNNLLEQAPKSDESKGYLNTNLKIFRIEDGENHLFVAKNKNEAIKVYKEYFDFDEADISENEYIIKEIPKNSNIMINIKEDEDLMNILNRFRINKKINQVNIWLYLKYWIITDILKGQEFIVPNIITSTTF